MASKHTDGEWVFKGDISFAQVQCADGTQKGRLAASIFHIGDNFRPMIRVGAPTDDPAEVAANAHLVAAASNLLKALEGAIGALEFSRDYHSDLSNEEQAFAQDRLDDAINALAKARGEG